MSKLSNCCLSLALVALLPACYDDPMSQRGFSLPEGDPGAGRAAFAYMQCNQCHTIANEVMAPVPGHEPYVELGGKVTAVKTYGELVTAIINPSHELARGYAAEVVAEDGESKMYNYNAFMTVQELIDLVAFLQPHYKVFVPETVYPEYPTHNLR
jgi:sulfur-oxidizing protein SoxX